jgi:hypothetical protein
MGFSCSSEVLLSISTHAKCLLFTLLFSLFYTFPQHAKTLSRLLCGCITLIEAKVSFGHRHIAHYFLKSKL